jgi:hypothetical protein
LTAVAAALLAGGCGVLPFGGPHLDTNAQLLNGAIDSLVKASSFEEAGAFSEGAYNFSVDIQFVAPATMHANIQRNGIVFEMTQIDGKTYYRSLDLAALLAASGQSDLRMTHAIGDRWFTSKTAASIDVSGALTNLSTIKATFFNTIGLKRKDNVVSGGVNSAELSGSDYALDISESSPHRLMSMRTASGKSVYGDFVNLDIAFTNYNKGFDIAAPTGSLDVDDATTWPPLYTRASMSNSHCNDPCILSAVFQNDGGTMGASSPSTVTFTLTDSSSGSLFGSCKVTIQPDVPHGGSVTETCRISSAAWSRFSGSYSYNAVPDNPSYD